MRVKKDGTPYRQSKTGSLYKVKGSRFFYMKYYKNGVPVVESTNQETQKKAERVLTATLNALARGDYLSPQDRKTTVADLWKGLIADYRGNGKSDIKQLEYKCNLRIKDAFGDLRVTQVTTDALNAYIVAQQYEGLSNATINKDMAALKRAFNLGYRCTPRKVQQMPVFPKRLKEAPSRKGFVEQAQYDKLAANAGSLWLRALLATAYAFGFRRSELLEMKVAQVNLLDNTITLYRGETKSGEPRLVKMTQDVAVLLQACIQDKGPEAWVFTRKGDAIVDIRDAWEAMCATAGLPGLLLHDLRRSAVRNMIRRGIPERVAMAISGHKTRSVFDRYNIVSEDDLTEAARKIEAGQKQVTESLPNQSGEILVKVGQIYSA